ncbi:sialate O-acetylesterase [Alkalitalea saponilacus]|nr:sialate O-acetylesterase [Alkalitalea saponilacus]
MRKISLKNRMNHFRLLRQTFVLLLSLFVMYSCKTDSELKLPSVFSNNMVLQQNIDATIWGYAKSGTEITVSSQWGAVSKAKAGEDGKWMLELATIEAGGPYFIDVEAGETKIRIENVLLGEVWLASGQSNMEMPLRGWPPLEPIYGSDEAIATSDYPGVRMFTVARNVSSTILNDVEGEWLVSSPETAGGFSATAYFFARKVHAETGVPVGIIHSSWGGTPAESWISGSTLGVDRDFTERVEMLQQAKEEEQKYNRWLDRFPMKSIAMTGNVDPLVGIDLFDEYGSSPETDVNDWPAINLPALIEDTEIGDFDGVIWFRKKIEIPESWIGKNLVLSLGPIDDRDVTWVNGNRVGGMEEDGLYQVERIYNVPSEYVTDRDLLIAVRVIDTQGGGGIYGKEEQLKLFPEGEVDLAISLAGEWNYKLVGEIQGLSLYLFDPAKDVLASRPQRTMVLNSHTPTVLYNAMVAPLVPYGLKGVIWYQGETNVGRANQYMRLKSMLITDWRNHYKNDELSFYYVQLAPWHYNDVEGIASANLREAQRRMQFIPHTGMISTLDIGDLESIHPGNKKDVGERLALWALANDYGVNLPFTGPEPAKVSIINNRVEIEFDHAENGLVLSREYCGQFEISGADGVFHRATVILNDNSLVVESSEVREPVNVRYGYRNGAKASLFNGDMLPAPSFSTENEIAN